MTTVLDVVLQVLACPGILVFIVREGRALGLAREAVCSTPRNSGQNGRRLRLAELPWRAVLTNQGNCYHALEHWCWDRRRGGNGAGERTR